MTRTSTNESPLTTREIGKLLDENEPALQAAIEAETRAVQARDAAQVDAWSGRGYDRLNSAQKALEAATQARIDLGERRRILGESMVFAKERELVDRILQRRIEEDDEQKERAALLARRSEIRAEDAVIESKLRAVSNKAGSSFLTSQLANLRQQHPELCQHQPVCVQTQLSDILRQEPITELNTVSVAFKPVSYVRA